MLKNVVLTNGYAENMCKFSYIPRRAVGADRVDLVSDSDVENMIRGQQFVSKEKCRETIQKYDIKEKVNIHFKKFEKKKLAAICEQENCKWRLYGSINSQSDKMVIRSHIETHSCNPIGVVDLYSAPKIAADFLNEFRQNPKLSAELIMQRLALIVGRDPNDAAYVIAWAIVPVENKVYWQWFMELLRENLGLEEGNALALSSDQQKELAYAVKTVMCARHIFSNLRKRYKQMGPLHKVFWKCARAYNENAFQQTGHNKRKCKLDLVPKPPKLPRGRTFKNSKATTQSPLTDEP
ncbi:hypothetical protein YC2023_106470 [Brassica napus]